MTDREKLVELIEATTYESLGGYLVVKGCETAKTDPPPQDEDVLLRFSTGTMVVGGLREDGGWYANTDAEWYTDCETVPEKWQPLPEPQKEE